MSEIPPHLTDAAGDGEVVPEMMAKQGRRGIHVFIVLVISLALVIVALFGIWGLHATRLGSIPDNGGQGASRAANVQHFATPAPAAKQNPGPGSAPEAPSH